MSFFKYFLNLFFLLILLSFSSCEEEKEDSTSSSDGDTDSKKIELSLEFSRIEKTGLDHIKVDAEIKRNKKFVKDAKLSIKLSMGSYSSVVNNKNGIYSFNIIPTQTGEHNVQVSYAGVTVSRTPLVMKDVHSDWGQPMAVEGLVNTAGYEDGITITPGGEYLFVQTSPQNASGAFFMNASRANGGCGGAFKRLDPTRCSHRFIDEIPGPYTAPERPGFFDGRFSGNKILHNANSWGVGVEQAPNYAISSMFYGFKRQEDGSFKEPFFAAFSDVNDGIASPFGMSFLMNGDGTAKMLFTYNDPTDPDMVDLTGDGSVMVESYFDVYQADIILGKNNNLGDLVYSGTPGTHPIRGSFFPSKLVDFGKIGINGIAGTQGNSHLHAINGNIKSIWTDDEYDSGGDHGELSVYFLDSGDLDSGTWTKIQLPTNINVAGSSNEIQPFFNGDRLYFTRSGVHNPEVLFSNFTGDHTKADLADNSNWGTPETILTHDSELPSLNRIVAIGEPTVAVYKGEEYLYFVYVVVRDTEPLPPTGTGVNNMDFQAGFIKRN